MIHQKSEIIPKPDPIPIKGPIDFEIPKDDVGLKVRKVE